jgi:GxxExxY protein
MHDTSAELNELSGAVLAAAIEVHRHLGPAYLERVYGNALALELTARRVAFRREVPIEARYKDAVVGHGQVDFLVDERLVVELKAVAEILPLHRQQLVYYLRATELRLGLLLNFHAITMKNGIVRVVNSSS